MRASKKVWAKPRIDTIELAQARNLIVDALRLIEKDATLASTCAELRSILQAMEEIGVP